MFNRWESLYSVQKSTQNSFTLRSFGLTIAVPIIAVTLQTVWYMALLKWFSMTLSGLFCAFGALTLIFAIFYHKGLELSNKNNKLDNLPPVPKPQFIIPKCQPIGGIAMCVIFVTIFLGTPEVIVGVFGEHPAAIPVLNIEVVKKSLLLIITFALMGVIRECTKLIDGKYTIRLMIVTLVTDFISVILALVWLLNDKLISQEFLGKVNNSFQGSEAFIADILSKLNYMLLGMIIFALILDLLTTLVKAIKMGNYEKEYL